MRQTRRTGWSPVRSAAALRDFSLVNVQFGSVASHPDVRDAPGMSAMLPIATQSVRRNEASRCAKGDIRLRYSNCPGVLCHWTRLLAGRAYGLPMVTTLAAATGRE